MALLWQSACSASCPAQAEAGFTARCQGKRAKDPVKKQLFSALLRDWGIARLRFLISSVNPFKIALIVGGAVFAAPVYAAPVNLILNGGFENSTAIDTSVYPTSVGGIGQLVEVVNLPNWTRTVTKDPSSRGYAFVVNSQADYWNGNAYPNQGGGFPSYGSPSGGTNLFVWGPNIAPDPRANGFTGSPSGGKFMGIDGDLGRSKIEQTVTGLDTSRTYTLSFEYAGSQFLGETGATNQYWQIGLNGSTFDTPHWVNPSQGFTPWQTYTTTFTPTSSTLSLSFEAFGSAASGSGASLPPFLLLDNVQLLDSGGGGGGGGGSEPAPGPLPAAGMAAAFAWSRRLRRRIQG